MTRILTPRPRHRQVDPLGAPAVSLRSVTRSFSERRVLGPVGLDLQPGAVCVVQGANGTGKTTLLRLASGLLAPTTGTRHASGLAVYVRPDAGARGEQSVGQALDWAHHMAAPRGMTPVEALRVVGLTVPTQRKVATLSSGQHSRLALAIALVTGPALACVDEPTAHMDTSGRDGVTRALGALTTAGSAVLVATPALDTLDCPADALLRLRDGRLEVAP